MPPVENKHKPLRRPLNNREIITVSAAIVLMPLAVFMVSKIVMPIPAPVPLIQIATIDETPSIRNDIKAYIIADLNDENDNTLYYVLRFYSTASTTQSKISGPIAVATSSVAVDEQGNMSIQVIDDFSTQDGALYASAVIDESVIDPADIVPEVLQVGDPCIVVMNSNIVSACNSYPLEVNTGSTASHSVFTALLNFFKPEVAYAQQAPVPPSGPTPTVETHDSREPNNKPAGQPRVDTVDPRDKPDAKPHDAEKPKTPNIPPPKRKDEPKVVTKDPREDGGKTEDQDSPTVITNGNTQ